MLLSIDCIQGNATSRAIDRQKDTCLICLRAAGKTASIISPFEHNDIRTAAMRGCRGSTLASRFRAAGGIRVVPWVLVDNS